MSTFLHHFSLAAPLFILVFVGYTLVRWAGWPKSVADALSRFVFSIALPAMLFRLMSDLSRLPPVDTRLLLAFFGACLIVFALGRLIAWRVFRLDGVGQSVFALGGVFSNNVLLGLPLARTALGDAAVPSVALVLVFNALILWTLVTVSVEWSRHGSLSLEGFGATTKSVLSNPIVAAIVSGSLFGLLGFELPLLVAAPLDMSGQAAAPLALIALGMSLAEYGLRAGWRESCAIVALKLIVQPLVVWGLALALRLPPLETRVVVLLASLAVGVNVYLMSKQFATQEAAVASSMVLSTGLAAITTPLFLALTGALS
ncbi:MAG TPA: AEC family transporter [Accumulibacter sp.]|uniref:AEC family transporter n=3 Tax=Accumulibacter sp. TaxID=2053492 RepID=UPI002CE67884|nr:AEC family transporter [Accumulibacter sp.]HMV04941.1 AEC family transporter [Accumulibacter sp.]HMW63200.1 AEC family transporter [Accumulibacter sp.]HMW80391.1 AEC family transporter [Accumulibacter sp.]HND40011.1 AEC family transporter [Accumulibacter sp.]HNG85935.1 AEC family transporter [Accumulibacter sp.]